MAQSIVYITDANGVKQPIACVPFTWDGVSNVNLQAAMLAPWTPTLVSGSGVTVIKNAPGVLGAVINLSGSGAQPGTIQVYDNASAASGPYYVSATNLADQVSYLPSGIAMTNGITVSLSQAALGEGFLILWL